MKILRIAIFRGADSEFPIQKTPAEPKFLERNTHLNARDIVLDGNVSLAPQFLVPGDELVDVVGRQLNPRRLLALPRGFKLNPPRAHCFLFGLGNLYLRNLPRRGRRDEIAKARIHADAKRGDQQHEYANDEQAAFAQTTRFPLPRRRLDPTGHGRAACSIRVWVAINFS